MSLSEIIIEKIQNEGPVSFRDYMDICLYYPELGYYTSSTQKIGPEGDFFTSSNLNEVFGAMIGAQIAEMWSNLGEEKFTIVEYGAGTGRLCHDILDYLKCLPNLYNGLTYCIIEKSPVMREIEKKHLNEKVKWVESILDIPEFNGCVLSNELLDNFPVHQVVMRAELMEVFVDYKNGFLEILRPAERQLKEYLKELHINLENDYRAEINLQAKEWIIDISKALKKGYVITIDYGNTSKELYTHSRRNGTLMCYYKHKVTDDPYMRPGEQDITSHVNFSALVHWGAAKKLEFCGLTNQANFLLSLGYKDFIRNKEVGMQDIFALAKEEALVSKTLLIDMGERFKVLIQRKGNLSANLKGLGS